jgi:hypothetical protein
MSIEARLYSLEEGRGGVRAASTLNQVSSSTSQDGVAGHGITGIFGHEDSTEGRPRMESEPGSGHLELLIRGSGWRKR